ncbi:MAG: hypothetical protein KF819_12265 [Labilithrix sp.]|nr:hypothetical protein [Labilithrix sp.]
MKLVGSFGVLLAAMMLGGCGAGAQGPRAKAPDIFDAMDAELAHAVSTTTVTSAAVDAPARLESSLPPAIWEDESEVLRTWGTPEDPYGF